MSKLEGARVTSKRKRIKLKLPRVRRFPSKRTISPARGCGRVALSTALKRSSKAHALFPVDLAKRVCRYRSDDNGYYTFGVLLRPARQPGKGACMRGRQVGPEMVRGFPG